MKTNPERHIVAALDDAMKARGWPAIELHGLPICYARNIAVTPYFRCSSLEPKAQGEYAIDGAFGIIHQEFEVALMKNRFRQPLEPGFAVILNLLNLPGLCKKRFIASESVLEKDVADFATAAATVLDGMPQTESDLKAAIEKDVLCGLEWNAFSGYSHRSKFRVLQEFLATRKTDPAAQP